jgi:hypothetical protein
MFWRPFNFLGILSLLLVLVLAGLCGWSYHRTDVFGYVSSASSNKCTEFCLASSRGQLNLLAVIDSPPVLTADAGKFGTQVSDPQQARANFGMMGFAASRQWSSSDRNGVIVVGAPYWFLILMAVFVPAWFSHRRRRKQAKKE